MSEESFRGIEVDAPHFNNIIGDLNYKFYSLTERNIPGFPKKNRNKINIKLEENCCQWIEETNDHSTRIFFTTADKETAENIKSSLLTGKDTKDVLPLIQNNYDKIKVFNNIAVCGDIGRVDNWEIDRVKRDKFEGFSKNNYNYGRGFVYHVTNVIADTPPIVQTLSWDKIQSRKLETGYKYHPRINLEVCFVSTTLYSYGSYIDSLPTTTMYPFDNKGGVNYYKRIKFPFKNISERNVTNKKGELEEEFSKVFYLCSAFSQVNKDPSNNVTQVHYICGFNIKEIKEYLENVSQIKIFSKEETIKKIRTEKSINNIEVDYIIAIKDDIPPKDKNDLPQEMLKGMNELCLDEIKEGKADNKVYK